MKGLTVTAEKRLILRRVIVFGVATFILGVLQCSFFSRLKPFGAVPDILLGMLMAIMLLDSKKTAAVTAVAAGYFVDALGAVPPAFSPLFYLICVALVGMIADKMIPQFISFAAIMLPTVALGAVNTYISLWISLEGLPPLSAFTGVIFPELIATFIISLPIYFLIKLCMLPVGARGRFRD